MSTKKDSFSTFVTLSLAFHIALLAALTVKILFFPSETPEHEQAVRIDVVALPDKNIEPAKSLEPKKPEPIAKKEPQKSKPKPEPQKPKLKPKPKVAIKKPKPKPKKEKPVEEVQEEQDSAIARLKAMQKLKEQQGKSQPQEYKGNQLSKGSALTGLAKLHHESYLDELDGHIRSYWNLPEWLANGNFKARVLLLINREGEIQGKSFVQKSGNDLFDQHVFSTLEKASPLPAPPPNLVDYFATKGVEIRFPE